MQCPRCKQENIPGLETCFYCGQNLNESQYVPPSFVPKVQEKSPLLKGKKKPFTNTFRNNKWNISLRAQKAALYGIIPGLPQILNRDLIGFLLLAIWLILWVGIWLTWTSYNQYLVWVLIILYSLGSGSWAAYNAYALNARPFFKMAASVFATVPMIFAARVIYSFLVTQVFFDGQIRAWYQAYLPNGRFMLKEVDNVELNYIIVMKERAFPVIALEGQKVEVENHTIFVDDNELLGLMVPNNIKNYEFIVPDGQAVILSSVEKNSKCCYLDQIEKTGTYLVVSYQWRPYPERHWLWEKR